jgi:hypothetical protein
MISITNTTTLVTNSHLSTRPSTARVGTHHISRRTAPPEQGGSAFKEIAWIQVKV